MSVASLVGNTPLVEIVSLFKKPHVKIYAKLEGGNPGGSVKDRAALNMLREALSSGKVSRGDRLVEATSGNTGIALAMCSKILGLSMTLVMPDNSSEERVRTMRAYGARVILTPTALGGIEHSRVVAEKMVREEGYYMLDQFSNDDNWKAHYRSTGPEVWEATNGKITHFVSSMGTTGTIMGTSRYLKEKNKEVTIVGVQPEPNSFIPGIRRWSPEFVPKIFEPHRVDRVIDVSEDGAIQAARDLASNEGLFVGPSSGGAFLAALTVAREIQSGVVVFVCCDRGDRYLSANIFGGEEGDTDHHHPKAKM